MWTRITGALSILRQLHGPVSDQDLPNEQADISTTNDVSYKRVQRDVFLCNVSASRGASIYYDIRIRPSANDPALVDLLLVLCGGTTIHILHGQVIRGGRFLRYHVHSHPLLHHVVLPSIKSSSHGIRFLGNNYCVWCYHVSGEA